MGTQAPFSSNLLNKKTAAEVLNVSLRTLDNHIKAGRLPFVKLGKLVRFIPSDIDKFIEERRVR
jgi:excisionase family DNA binding protein